LGAYSSITDLKYFHQKGRILVMLRLRNFILFISLLLLTSLSIKSHPIQNNPKFNSPSQNTFLELNSGIVGFSPNVSLSSTLITDTSFCDVVTHPERFNKKLIRIAVTYIRSGWHGYPLLEGYGDICENKSLFGTIKPEFDCEIGDCTEMEYLINS